MMKITYWGVFDSAHPRNRIFIEGLYDRSDTELTVLHRPVLEKSNLSTGKVIGFFGLLLLLLKLKFAYFGLIRDYFKYKADTDIWVCGYIGQLDVIVLSLLKRFTKDTKPILFNPLMSIHDTLITDKEEYPEKSFTARLIKKIDTAAFSRASHIIMDTESHRNYIIEKFNLPEEKVSTIWVGSEASFFRPPVKLPKTAGRPFIAQFVGKFIPLHGIDVILEAAKWFKKEDVIFEIIGSGKLDEWFAGAIAERNLENIRLIPWMDYAELPEKIRQSHLSLGIFSTNAKSQRVIPNKVFQALALGRIIITAQSDGVAELQAKGIPIVAVKPDSGEDLARLINTVKDGYADMHGFALQVKKLSRENFAPSILVEQFTELCQLIIDNKIVPIEKTNKTHVEPTQRTKTTEEIWNEVENQKAQEKAGQKDKAQSAPELLNEDIQMQIQPVQEPTGMNGKDQTVKQDEKTDYAKITELVKKEDQAAIAKKIKKEALAEDTKEDKKPKKQKSAKKSPKKTAKATPHKKAQAKKSTKSKTPVKKKAPAKRSAKKTTTKPAPKTSVSSGTKGRKKKAKE